MHIWMCQVVQSRAAQLGMPKVQGRAALILVPWLPAALALGLLLHHMLGAWGLMELNGFCS